mmetsp:Transcript_35740/g.63736  ORF Transcript_35740/g.63736 Transcript_35740/m.63736 type:complete len:429 (-) Transcript_35740:180-1466(-)
MLRTISSLLSRSRDRVRSEQENSRVFHEVEGEKRLRLRYTISDIVEIDTVGQLFKVKILVHVRWWEDYAAYMKRTAELLEEDSDENCSDMSELVDVLSSLSPGAPKPVPWDAVKRVWDPKIFLENRGHDVEITEPERASVQRTEEFPDRVWVNYSVRLSGDFRCAMDLRQFPFDKQLLVIKILTQHPIKDEGYKSGVAARIEGQRTTDDFSRRFLQSENPAPDCLMLDEWHLDSSGHEVIDHSNWEEFKHLGQRLKLALPLQRYASGRTYSRLYIAVAMKRKPQFYISKIYAPLFLLACTNFSVFRIPEFGDQIATLVTILLAIVAYQYIVASMVPKIAYNTELDIYILGCFAVTMTIFVSCVLLDLIKEHQLSPDPTRVMFLVEASAWVLFQLVMGYRVGLYGRVARYLFGRKSKRSVQAYFPLSSQ